MASTASIYWSIVAPPTLKPTFDRTRAPTRAKSEDLLRYVCLHRRDRDGDRAEKGPPVPKASKAKRDDDRGQDYPSAPASWAGQDRALSHVRRVSITGAASSRAVTGCVGIDPIGLAFQASADEGTVLLYSPRIGRP